MVVRFDNTALKQTIEQKKEPIGVDGDPASVRGGISEADAIVKEARKSLSLPDGPIPPEEVNRVSKEIIREEEEKEPGPELDPEGHKKLNEIKK
jgi:protein phosphatase PTC1